MTDVLFTEYPNCSIYQKAKKRPRERDAACGDHDIATDEPCGWHKRSGLPPQRFFDTSSLFYRELESSKKLLGMTESAQLNLLIINGMLVKRPPPSS